MRVAVGARLLAAAFLCSGTLHLLRPGFFEGIVPHGLPHPRALVYLSGAAELVCGGGLLNSRTRSAAGVASAALLVAVFPANVQMALDAHRSAGSAAYRLVTYLRLPLQLPLIWIALRAAGWRTGRRRLRP
jgi:uncharacterized membrane protein